MDYEGIKTLLRGADRAFPRLRHLWLDAGYRGEGKGADWVRTLSWIDQNRRMSKDYERSCASGEALVYAAI